MTPETTRNGSTQRWYIAGAVLLMAVVISGLDIGSHLAPTSYRPTLVYQVLASLPLAIVVAYLAARMFTSFSAALKEKETAWAEAVSRLEYLEARNAILQVLATTTDLRVAFTTLSDQIRHIVACDRVTLSLLSENGEELHTFSGQPATAQQASAVQPDLQFRRAGTLMDELIRSSQPAILADVRKLAADYLDANVLASGGYMSALGFPLIFEGKPLGTLTLIAREKDAFTDVHLRAVQPVAQTIALACGTQQLARRLAHTQLAEAIAEMAFAMANEINGAMQTIVGHCELAEREHAEDLPLQRDLATIVRQAHRVIDAMARLRKLVPPAGPQRSPAEADGAPPSSVGMIG